MTHARWHGAGDGRIVIAAARWRGAHGVGIEIDPDLVRHARREAERAGVADRVRFEIADLFAAPLGDATVVTLYLSPELNARLRPRLLTELRPGARIVSHQVPMADWAPARSVRLVVDGREHVLHLWIVPPRTPSLPRRLGREGLDLLGKSEHAYDVSWAEDRLGRRIEDGTIGPSHRDDGHAEALADARLSQ